MFIALIICIFEEKKVRIGIITPFQQVSRITQQNNYSKVVPLYDGVVA